MATVVVKGLKQGVYCSHSLQFPLQPLPFVLSRVILPMLCHR